MNMTSNGTPMTESQIAATLAKLEADKAEFTPLFERVQNRQDWKAPIRAIIHRVEFDKVNAAIEFFTATSARIVGEVGLGQVMIEADGYRRGPAGDH